MGDDRSGQLLDRPVFVVGPPRSGTTLLRVMLCRSPELHVATETHFLDLWLPRFPALERDDPAAVDAYWTAFAATPPFTYLGFEAEEVPTLLRRWRRWDAAAVFAAIVTASMRAHGAIRGGEKTPDHAQHLDRLMTWFPEARVLYVLRDPRAVVASELRLDRDWASDDPDVASQRWRRSAEPWLRWRHDPRVRTVRFEDLITHPERELRGACEHVGVAFGQALLNDRGGHETYQHGQGDPWGALDPSVSDAWRGVLGARALVAVAEVCAPLCRSMGYPDPTEDLTGRQRMAVGGHRLRRRLARSLSPLLGRRCS